MLEALAEESYFDALQRQLCVFNLPQGLGKMKRAMSSGPERSIVDTVVPSYGIDACGRLSYRPSQGSGVVVDCIARRHTRVRDQAVSWFEADTWNCR